MIRAQEVDRDGAPVPAFLSGWRSGFASTLGGVASYWIWLGPRPRVARSVGAASRDGNTSPVGPLYVAARRARGDPDKPSSPVNSARTAWLYQPLLSGPRSSGIRTPGGEPSLRTMVVEVGSLGIRRGARDRRPARVAGDRRRPARVVPEDRYGRPGASRSRCRARRAARLTAPAGAPTTRSREARARTAPPVRAGARACPSCARSSPLRPIEDDQQGDARETEREQGQRTEDHRVRWGP